MSNGFLTAVFYQHAADMAKWASRGCNTAFGMDNGSDPHAYAAWKAACTAAGMKYIVQWIEPFTPAGAVNPYLTAADNADPNLIGVLLPDEPDGGGNISPGGILDMYNAAKTLLPDKPVFLNIDGDKTNWRPFCDYRCYAAGCDWIGMDLYVLNLGRGDGSIHQVGDTLDFLAKAASAAGGGKKLFCCLECSNEDLSKQAWIQGYPQIQAAMHGPSAAEMTLEVQQVIARPNVGMVVWFPEGIGASFEGSDVMTPEQVAAMTSLNMMLTSR